MAILEETRMGVKRGIMIAFILTCIFSGIPLYLRYSHPDMTTTRLSMEYWWVGLILALLVIPAALLAVYFMKPPNKR
jgi:hypothetical protein